MYESEALYRFVCTLLEEKLFLQQKNMLIANHDQSKTSVSFLPGILPS